MQYSRSCMIEEDSWIMSEAAIRSCLSGMNNNSINGTQSQKYFKNINKRFLLLYIFHIYWTSCLHAPRFLLGDCNDKRKVLFFEIPLYRLFSKATWDIELEIVACISQEQQQATLATRNSKCRSEYMCVSHNVRPTINIWGVWSLSSWTGVAYKLHD